MKTVYCAAKDLVIEGRTIAKGDPVAEIESDIPLPRLVAGLNNGAFTASAPASTPEAKPEAAGVAPAESPTASPAAAEPAPAAKEPTPPSAEVPPVEARPESRRPAPKPGK